MSGLKQMSDMPSRGVGRELPRRRTRESTSLSDGSARGVPGRGEAIDDDPVRTEAHRDGRGRGAETPVQIPLSGWKDIFWRLYENIQEHRILAIAGGVTFYALLAIFPGIAAVVALFGLFADPTTIGKQLTDLSSVLPSGAIEVIGDQLQRLTNEGHRALGLTFLLGLAVSIWSANAGVKALFDALNVVYAEGEERSFIKLNAISLAFTCGGLLFLLLALIALVVLPLIVDDLGLADAAQWLLALGKWPLLLVAIALGVALVYRHGPSREKAQWRWLTWGSAFAAVTWLVVSVLFSWYTANFGSYNKTYGSLGAVIGFMTWMWLSCIVILLGAELDAEMEHQTACDTTRGPPAPMGARGARMADTLGKES
jgi:membrane protein